MTDESPDGPAGRHASPERADHWLRSVRELRLTLGPDKANALVDDFRPAIPVLVETLVARISSDVTAYATEPGRRRHQLITMAVTAGINHFVSALEGQPGSIRSVDELFLRMGYGEAHDGNDLSAMHGAVRLATRDTWEQIRAFVEQRQLSSAELGLLGDALFGFLDHLTAQAERGYHGSLRASGADHAVTRIRLLDGLLSGASYETIRRDSESITWTLPREFVVLTVHSADDQPADLSTLPESALGSETRSPAVVVCDRAEETLVVEHVTATLPKVQLAKSWPVRREEVPDAYRWTQRALRLAHSGIIPEAPLIDTARHRTQLWLHSEPAIRRRLTQELLRPLLAETPNSREILSETLLIWLETRDSAPAIAAKLGVHAQTVRYRWKRINELFGEQLRDPELVVQLTMLLKASVPLWRAGDQSDFQRYRNEDAS